MYGLKPAPFKAASYSRVSGKKSKVMSDFLLEIGLEEVPARMIAGAEAELGRRVNELLTRERLLGPAAKLTTYSTPRRLAVLVEDVLASQADTEEKLTGPSWKVAFKDGAPTAAAEAFAKKAGVAVSALEKVANAKGEYVGATVKRQGRAAAELLATELPKEVSGNLLGQEYVLARGQAGAVCAAGAVGRGAARCGGRSAGDCGDCGGEREPWSSHSAWRRARGSTFGEELQRNAARGKRGGRRGRAQAFDSQGAGCGDAHGCRRALARR